MQISAIKNLKASPESLLNSRIIRESKIFATNDKQCVILDKTDLQTTLLSNHSISRDPNYTGLNVSRSQLTSPRTGNSVVELSTSRSPVRKIRGGGAAGDFGSCLKYIPERSNGNELERELDSANVRRSLNLIRNSTNAGENIVSNSRNEKESIRKWSNLDVVRRSDVWIEARNRKMEEMKRFTKLQEVEPCTFQPTFFTKESKRWKHRSVYATPNKESNTLRRSANHLTIQSPQEESLRNVAILVSPKGGKTDFTKIKLSQGNIPGFNDKWYHQRSYKYSHDIRKRLIDENIIDNQNRFTLNQTSSHSSLNQAVSLITAKDGFGNKTDRTLNGVVSCLEER